MRGFYIGSIILLFFLFTGCKKDQDESPPSVQILSPTGANPDYNVGDTIIVRVAAQDETMLDLVKVELLRTNNSFVAGAQGVNPSGNSMEQFFHIALDNIHLPTDQYVLRASASDGVNDNFAFKEVTVYEAPLVVKNVYATSSIANSTEIFALNGSQWESAANVPHSSTQAFPFSYSCSLIVLDEGDGNMSFIEGESSTIFNQTQITGTAVGNKIFDIANDPFDGGYHLSLFEGRIWSYNDAFSQFNSVTSAGNIEYGTVLALENNLVAEAQIVGNGARTIELINKNSGSTVNAIPIDQDFDVHFMKSLSNNKVLVLGNSNGEAEVKRLDLDNSIIESDLFSINDLPIRDVVIINDTWISVAHQGQIVSYNYPDNSFIEISGIDASKLAFDSTSGILYALDGNQIHLVNPLGGNVISTIAAPVGCIDISVLFNK